MKLSVWSSYYWELTPEDALKELSAHKYAYTELSDEHGDQLLHRGDPEKIGAAYKAFADDLGVSMPQGHLWLKVNLCDADEDYVVTTLCRWLDLYYACGVKNAVLHCDSRSFPESTVFEEKVERNARVLRRLCRHLGDSDMVICLENLPVPEGITPVVATVDQLKTVIAAVDNDKHLGICLDTGHLNLVAGQSQRDFILKAGKDLRALHIADNEGQRDQHMMPFGRGSIDFAEVLAACKEIGYDGLYNLEIPGERSAPLPILGYKLDYIRNVFAYLESTR